MNPNCSQSSRSAISAFILSIGLFCFVGSVNADQWGDWKYTSDGTNVTITGYTGTNTDIIIPDVISNKTVVAIGGEAFYYSGITSVVFPPSITTIGYDAFHYCFSLTNACLPINIVHIGYFAFASCFSLKSVYIPASLTDLGSEVFGFCTGLTDITVSVSNPYYASTDGVLYDKNHTYLIQCPSMKTGAFVIPDGVTSLGGAAFLDSMLDEITLPVSIINLGESSTFYGAAIKSITIPYGVTSLSDHLLYSCLSLTNVIVCGEVTKTWTEALANCPSLRSVHFKGNAPTFNVMTFNGSSPTVFFLPWTSGWGTSFQGRPTQIEPSFTQWLLNNNFSTNGLESTTNDFDHDGMLNWQEYLAGTNPTNISDKLAISFTGTETNSAQISWRAKSNVSYQVMKTTDLQGTWGNASSDVGGNQQAFQTAPMDQILQYVDPGYVGSTNAFYRVNVVP